MLLCVPYLFLACLPAFFLSFVLFSFPYLFLVAFFVYLLACLLVCFLACSLIRLLIRPFVRSFVRLFACLFVCLLVCLSVCLSVCFFDSFFLWQHSSSQQFFSHRQYGKNAKLPGDWIPLSMDFLVTGGIT